jgi:hypothetical protein
MQQEGSDALYSLNQVDKSRAELAKTLSPNQISPAMIGNMQAYFQSQHKNRNEPVQILTRALKQNPKGLTLKNNVALVVEQL